MDKGGDGGQSPVDIVGAIMGDMHNCVEASGFHLKLWRGERMCLIGMDVDQPEDDFVGFAIEVKEPDAKDFAPLSNRLAFSYPTDAASAVTGKRQFSSLDAPFQKFRWMHFPDDPKSGGYCYRVTKMHMPSDGPLKKGTSLTCDISLDPVLYKNFLDVGFTRNFASSQAYAEKFGNDATIIPATADEGLKFQKKTGKEPDVYRWLGFEAYEMIFGMLNEAVNDPSMSLDVLVYDFNEPDILALLAKMGKRLRIVIDDSATHGKDSAETAAAGVLAQSAGPENVKRTHFKSLQHNKVLIAKKDGKPVSVLFGSTNYSFRGLYIQANNALRFDAPEAAGFFEQMFELAFNSPGTFSAAPLAKQWQLVTVSKEPAAHLCFSPHADSNLSLNPVGAAIDQASSSVFFSVAFLNQIKSGPTHDAIARLAGKDVFSYGISDKEGGLNIHKPDGTLGIVDFAYLAANTPEPFAREWSGGVGVHLHHKFVVTDFNLPTAKVFTGSSNLSPAGETGNGDNLVMIEDCQVATSFALEALRMFDHLHFRNLMQTGKAGTTTAEVSSGKASAEDKAAMGAKEDKDTAHSALTLRKPTKLSGQPAWFADYYKAGSQAERDRVLFSGEG
jgi:phosphatidylserine/phosphatidylglycerophosphate/cardiolipin synthase-like enzyme